MQLFITPYIQEHSKIIITEERVVQQLRTVLRAKAGYEFNVQHAAGDVVTRIRCTITGMDHDKIEAEAIDQEIHSLQDDGIFLFVAMPNRFEKLELIVQKCTEIGLQHIIFFPSQYSQLRELSAKKIERLGKIALEAAEQSYGLLPPHIIFQKDISVFISQGENFLLHQDGEDIRHSSIHDDESQKNFFIGPEGGRGSEDEKMFIEYPVQKISLGKNILRTETAVIIMAREAKNRRS